MIVNRLRNIDLRLQRAETDVENTKRRMYKLELSSADEQRLY